MRVDPMNPCDGCALTSGACANQEPYNHLRARICARAGIPFYCHDTKLADWRSPVEFKVAILKHQPIPICQGWTREVRQLVAAGHFKKPEVREVLKQVGTMALLALEKFVNTDRDVDPYGKANAEDDLEVALSVLFADNPVEETREWRA